MTTHSFPACMIACQVLKLVKKFLWRRKARIVLGKPAEEISTSMPGLGGR